jgi:hypothetical protein
MYIYFLKSYPSLTRAISLSFVQKRLSERFRAVACICWRHDPHGSELVNAVVVLYDKVYYNHTGIYTKLLLNEEEVEFSPIHFRK